MHRHVNVLHFGVPNVEDAGAGAEAERGGSESSGGEGLEGQHEGVSRIAAGRDGEFTGGDREQFRGGEGGHG